MDASKLKKSVTYTVYVLIRDDDRDFPIIGVYTSGDNAWSYASEISNHSMDATKEFSVVATELHGLDDNANR